MTLFCIHVSVLLKDMGWRRSSRGVYGADVACVDAIHSKVTTLFVRSVRILVRVSVEACW